MFTQQDRARVGAKLRDHDRELMAIAARDLRITANSKEYRKDESFDSDVLLDLADQLDQIAMPIVVERKS